MYVFVLFTFLLVFALVFVGVLGFGGFVVFYAWGHIFAQLLYSLFFDVCFSMGLFVL
jgi:hypothetical protein